MSGHSKWKTIKHKKEKEDIKKGKVFTRLAREIMVVARDGGPDAAGNARLRILLDKARLANMPKDNIERAIKKGAGHNDGCNFEQIFYEGYGPVGTAVIVEVMTDNKNRTVSTLRHFFSKNGGTLAENGAVSWMFEQKGLIEVAMGNLSEDAMLEKLIDCDTDDIKFDEPGQANVFCQVKDVDTLRKQIEELGLTIKSVQIVWQAKELVELAEQSTEEKAIKFFDELEDLDDVQNVYANF